MIYGPLAFLSGIMWQNGFKWMVILPASWFVGMAFSHLVFNRCVLNEAVIRLTRVKKKSKDRVKSRLRTIKPSRIDKCREAGGLLTLATDYNN